MGHHCYFVSYVVEKVSKKECFDKKKYNKKCVGHCSRESILKEMWFITIFSITDVGHCYIQSSHLIFHRFEILPLVFFDEFFRGLVFVSIFF